MPKHIFTTAWIGKGEGILRDWHKILGRRDYALDDEEDWLIVDSNVLKYLKDTKDEKNPNKTMLQVAEEKGVKVITDHQVFDDIINSDEAGTWGKEFGKLSRKLYTVNRSLKRWAKAFDIMKIVGLMHPDIKNGDIYINRDSDITFGAKRATNVAPMEYGLRGVPVGLTRHEGGEITQSISHNSLEMVLKEVHLEGIDETARNNLNGIYVSPFMDCIQIQKGSIAAMMSTDKLKKNMEKILEEEEFLKTGKDIENLKSLPYMMSLYQQIWKEIEEEYEGECIIHPLYFEVDSSFYDRKIITDPINQVFLRIWEKEMEGANALPEELSKLKKEKKDPTNPFIELNIYCRNDKITGQLKRVMGFLEEILMDPIEIGIKSRQNDFSWKFVNEKTVQQTSDVDSDLDVSDPEIRKKIKIPKKFDMSKRDSRIKKLEEARLKNKGNRKNLVEYAKAKITEELKDSEYPIDLLEYRGDLVHKSKKVEKGTQEDQKLLHDNITMSEIARSALEGKTGSQRAQALMEERLKNSKSKSSSKGGMSL